MKHGGWFKMNANTHAPVLSMYYYLVGYEKTLSFCLTNR